MADKSTTNQEREKLLTRLDSELEDYIGKLASKGKAPYKDGFSEDNWEKVIITIPYIFYGLILLYFGKCNFIIITC